MTTDEQEVSHVEIGATELHRMTDAVDARHSDAMTAAREAAGDRPLDGVGASRRRFLQRAGAGGAAFALGSALLATPARLGTAEAQTMSDVDVAVYARSIELAMVAIYGRMAAALSSTTQPVGVRFAQHHQDHADAFGFLAGEQSTDAPNAALLAALTPQLDTVQTEGDALRIAFDLENQAAATYAFALTVLTVPAAIASTTAILPIESEHAAILGIAVHMDLPNLFPNGAFESASVGTVGDPKTGLDPAKYPAG